MSPATALKTITTHHISLRLDSPLHHGAFGHDTGNAVLHRRMPVVLPDGSVVDVPAFSGNALRGAIRRVVMRDLFDLTGVTKELVDQSVLSPRQWSRLYGALANGGHLQQAETRTDPEAQRQLRRALPQLSVLGAALYSYMLAGRIAVGWLWPVCAETVAVGICTPTESEIQPGEHLVTEVTVVRHIDRGEQDPALSGVTPMPVTVEALIPGTVLQGTITPLATPDPVEMGAIGWGLNQIVALGGKAGSGFGRFQIEHDIVVEPYEEWRASSDHRTLAREALMAIALGAG